MHYHLVIQYWISLIEFVKCPESLNVFCPERLTTSALPHLGNPLSILCGFKVDLTPLFQQFLLIWPGLSYIQQTHSLHHPLSHPGREEFWVTLEGCCIMVVSLFHCFCSCFICIIANIGIGHFKCLNIADGRFLLWTILMEWRFLQTTLSWKTIFDMFHELKSLPSSFLNCSSQLRFEIYVINSFRNFLLKHFF